MSGIIIPELKCPICHEILTIDYSSNIRICYYCFNGDGLSCKECLITCFPKDQEMMIDYLYIFYEQELRKAQKIEYNSLTEEIECRFYENGFMKDSLVIPMDCIPAQDLDTTFSIIKKKMLIGMLFD